MSQFGTTFLHLQHVLYVSRLLTSNRSKIFYRTYVTNTLVQTDVPCHILLMSFYSRTSHQLDVRIEKQLIRRFHLVHSERPWSNVFPILDNNIDTSSCMTLILALFHSWKASLESSPALQLLKTMKTDTKSLLLRPVRYKHLAFLPLQQPVEKPPNCASSVLATAYTHHRS